MRLGRVLAVIVGVVLTAFGVLTLIGTIAGLVMVGFDDTLDTGNTDFDTRTAAIAAETGNLSGDSGNRSWGPDSVDNLKVGATGDKEMFLGVGPKDRVNEYLDQAPWDEVDFFSANRWSSSSSVDYTRKGPSGSVRDLPAPTGESFWTQQSAGRSVNLDWDVPDDGDYTVVLMNADGSANVATRGTIEVKIPHLSVALVAGIAIGAAVFLLGLLFLFKIGRGRANPRGHTYQAPAPA